MIARHLFYRSKALDNASSHRANRFSANMRMLCQPYPSCYPCFHEVSWRGVELTVWCVRVQQVALSAIVPLHVPVVPHHIYRQHARFQQAYRAED